MKRSVLFRCFTVSAIAFVMFTGSSCRKSASSPDTAGPHQVKIFLTDDPSLTFDHIFLDIQKLEIKVEDSAEDRRESEHETENNDNDRHGDVSGGWMSLPIQPGLYDILRFQNGLDTLLATGSFAEHLNLRKVRLTLGTNSYVVIGDTNTPLITNDNQNIIVIKFGDDFLDDSPSAISFSLDFDASRSIKMKGNHLELQPEVRAFRKEREGSIEGRALPAQASPVAWIIQGTDTVTARPGREGEFKIDGLKPGSYMLQVHATAGLYQDTILNNIMVTAKEDVRLGTITLHP